MPQAPHQSLSLHCGSPARGTWRWSNILIVKRSVRSVFFHHSGNCGIFISKMIPVTSAGARCQGFQYPVSVTTWSHQQCTRRRVVCQASKNDKSDPVMRGLKDLAGFLAPTVAVIASEFGTGGSWKLWPAVGWMVYVSTHKLDDTMHARTGQRTCQAHAV